MKITKCCCCFDVRTGAYITVIFGALRGIFYLSCFLSIMDIQKKIEQILLELDTEREPDQYFSPLLQTNKKYFSVYCFFAGTVLFTFNNILLLFGLMRNRLVCIQIWLLIEGIIGSVSLLSKHL